MIKLMELLILNNKFKRGFIRKLTDIIYLKLIVIFSNFLDLLKKVRHSKLTQLYGVLQFLPIKYLIKIIKVSIKHGNILSALKQNDKLFMDRITYILDILTSDKFPEFNTKLFLIAVSLKIKLN